MGLVCAGPARVRAAARRGHSRPLGPVKSISRPCRVVMWAHSREDAGNLAQSRTSARLPGFVLSDAVHLALNDADAMRDAALIVSAIPVQFTREAWTRLRRACALPGLGL
jgi:glycerol-3-phosphate dehydrogenase